MKKNTTFNSIAWSVFGAANGVVENSKPVENFGIDTDSMGGAIMGLHVNNKKGATWTRSLGKPSWLNQIST